MSRIIFCHFYNKDAEGLDFQTYPGKLGERIYNEISKQAWNEWISKQTMLINEKKLNMTDPTHRELLRKAMVKFLFEGGEIKIKGFTPQNKP